MKSIFLCLVFGLLHLAVNVSAQTPSWNWAQAITPIQGSVFSGHTDSDAIGNIFVTGYGYTAGGINFGNSILPPEGMYLAKYSTNGNLLWTKLISKNCSPNAIHTDPAGNSYITGRFRDTVSVGGTSIICQGEIDIFIMKFDSSGNLIWANRAGGPGRAPGYPPPIMDEDEGTTIGADSVGNVFVGGFYYARAGTTATFDTISLSVPVGASVNFPYGFIAKYNKAGRILWHKKIDFGMAHQNISKIAVSPVGNFYLSGDFRGSIQFGPGSQTHTSTNSNSDVFLAAFDPNGTHRWSKSLGGTDSEYGQQLALSKLEECFIAGSFKSPNFQIGTFNLSGSAQKGTVYVAKYNNTGNSVWAAQTTGPGSIGDVDITLDATGNPYVAAWFSGTVTVGQQTISASNISNGSAAVMKWSTTGAPVWAITPQGMGSSLNITGSRTNNDIHLAGAFSGTTSFGNYSVYSPQFGIFIAKLSSQPTGLNETTAHEISVYPNPAERILHLNLPEAKEPIALQLTDMRGQIVLSKNLLANKETKIDLPELAKGIYILTARTGQQIYRQKVVIQ